MLGIGAFGFAYGLYANDARLWASFLLNAFFFLTLALGAIVFVSINRVANAGWDTVIRRVPEAMMNYLPLGSLAMLVIFFGRDTLYEGLRTTFGTLDVTSAMEADSLLPSITIRAGSPARSGISVLTAWPTLAA